MCEIQHRNRYIIKGKQGRLFICASPGLYGAVPFAVLPQGRGKGKAILPCGSCTLLQPCPISLHPDHQHFQKSMSSEIFFSLQPFAPRLDKWQQTSHRKGVGARGGGGGGASRLPLSITSAFGSLHLPCSLPHPSISLVLDPWSNRCCVAGVLIKGLRWALFCLGTSGH